PGRRPRTRARRPPGRSADTAHPTPVPIPVRRPPRPAGDVRRTPCGSHPGAVLDRLPDPVDGGEVDHRVDALRVQVQCERRDVDVPGAFAVAEDAALDPLRTGEYGELRAGDAGTAVVVRVHRQDHAVAPRQVLVHVLDLVGVHV